MSSDAATPKQAFRPTDIAIHERYVRHYEERLREKDLLYSLVELLMDTCCHVLAAGFMKQREAAIAKIDEDPKLDRYTKIISGKISYPDSFSPVKREPDLQALHQGALKASGQHEGWAGAQMTPVASDG